MFRRNIMASACALFALSAAPIYAQATAQAPASESVAMAAGAAVTDPQGGAVGTIESVDGDIVVLKTDRNQVRFPTSSFAKTETGFMIAMTQAEVNAAVDAEKAKAAQMIIVGASVQGSQGSVIGTIDAIDNQFVTLKLAGSETLVKLPKAAVGAGPTGPLIGLSQAELQAQVGVTPAAEAGSEAEAEATPQ